MSVEEEKRGAAEAAAQLVEDGMTVGLGTGTTVAYLLPALTARGLTLRCVATSLRTEEEARSLGLPVEPFSGIARLDIAIDGADQVAPDGWIVKGGGGAHTAEKLVETIAAPIPLELLPYGLDATLARLGEVAVRGGPPSPDGGVIADYLGPVEDPAAVAAWLAATPGVVDHGLFPPALTSEVLVGRGAEVERLAV